MATSGVDDTSTVILCCNFFNNPKSVMCLFASIPTAEDGEAPLNIGTIFLAPPPGSPGFITWEGQQLTGNFTNTTLSFTTQIQGNAHSQPNNTQVGTGYHAPPFAVPPPGQPPYGYNVFNIFRDNDRVVYTDPVLGPCTTIYYCVWAGTVVAQIPDFVPIP